MRRPTILIAALVVAVALGAVACGGGGGEPELIAVEEEPTVASTATASPAPVTVPILSPTVGNLFDRPDLSSTVSDLADQPFVTMPDLFELEIDDAREVLELLGLVPYLVDTFPLFAGPEVVVDTLPFDGDSVLVGQVVFVEVDGPDVATVATSGEVVDGVLNGRQDRWTTDDPTWFITIWLDQPLALGGVEEPQVVGREIGVMVASAQVGCSSGDPLPDVDTLESGLGVSFVLEEDGADEAGIDEAGSDEAETVAPIPIRGSTMMIDCEPDL